MQTRFKGAAGAGSRGKNQPARTRGKVTPKRKRNTGGGQTLEKPSTPRANQKRNQAEWAKKKKMQTRY
jgi:hypothetical protein